MRQRTQKQKVSKHRPSIFQGKLDFSPTGSVLLTVEHPFEQSMVRMLLASLSLCGITYMYLVGTTIFNVIARKDAVAQATILSSKVADLEREYLAASGRVGPESGKQLGLVPVSKSTYIYRPGATAAAPTEPNAL